jgi:ATP-dependent DNA ligase
MRLPLRTSYPPMEAEPASELPAGPQWQYEPKWDGFRCLAFRDGPKIDLQSKSQKPLTRYFPELVAALAAIKAKKNVLDGEIVVPVEGSLSFSDLLMRIRPAASRIQKLSKETPSLYIVFDLLVDENGNSLVDLPLDKRRAKLKDFAKKCLDEQGLVRLSPVADNLALARKWFHMGVGLDGIVAKRRDLPYQAGERTAMQKIKISAPPIVSWADSAT